MKKYIESTMQMVTKTVALLLGVPYVVVIAINTFSGWPSSQGEDRYSKALHPQRVYKLNYAVMEHLFLLKWFPLWLKWNQFYRNSDASGKDHVFGRNKNRLDIWKPDSKSALSQDGGENQNKMPVLVYVYGGAWGTGDKGMYGLLGQSLANALGCVVCVPNYSIYPKGTVPDMLNDIEDAVHFIKSTDLIKSYGGDADNIVLIGHSAGGHLAAQLAIDLANPNSSVPPQEECRIGQVCEQSSRDNHKSYSEKYIVNTDSDNLNEGSVLAESDISKLNASATLPSSAELASVGLLHSIRGVVGIGGVYHVMDHYHHEAYRGVEDISSMWRAMQGLEKFDHFSPELRVQKLDQDNIKRLPPFLLIHGARDTTVPLRSSEKFAESLSAVNVPITLKVLVDGGHAELALDMMESGRTYYDPMIGILKDWMTSSQILE